MNGFKFMFEGVVDCSRFGTIGGGHTIRLASIAHHFPTWVSAEEPAVNQAGFAKFGEIAHIAWI